MFVLEGRKQSIEALAFSPDGLTLAAGGTSALAGVHLWDVVTRSRADPPPPVPAAVSNLWWTGHASPLLVVSTRGIGGRILRPPDKILTAVLPLSGFFIAAAGPGNKAWFTHRVSPSETALVQSRVEGQGRLRDVWRAPMAARGWASAVHPIAGGTRLLTMEYEPEANSYVGSHRILVRAASTGREEARLEFSSRDRALLAAPAGGLFAAACRTRAWVWKSDDGYPRTGELRNDSRGHFTALAFHPSGRYLAVTSNDQTVKFFDTATCQPAKSFTWDVGRMRSVAFSPDGTLAAAGGDTGKVVVWDVD